MPQRVPGHRKCACSRSHRDKRFISCKRREETHMIGMDFVSFLTLLIISVVVSGILHYGLNYYVTPGHWSFCSKIVVGWIGAWLLYLDIGGQAFVTAKSTSCPPS